jgi:hypothetical protein
MMRSETKLIVERQGNGSISDNNYSKKEARKEKEHEPFLWNNIRVS